MNLLKHILKGNPFESRVEHNRETTSVGIPEDRLNLDLADGEYYGLAMFHIGSMDQDEYAKLIKSWRQLSRIPEVDDAIEGKSVADMTRAKQIKSLFRMVTPHLTIKDIPMVVVNHTYKEIGMFPKDIVGGGTGSYYSADNIWVLGRQQDKVDNEIAGYHFVINIEKSRFVKEKSKIPITVSYEGGINVWSGLFEVALQGNYIAKAKAGWYAVVDRSSGELKEPNMRASDIVNNKTFWMDMFKNTDFAKYIEGKYKVAHASIIEDEDKDTE